MPVQNVVIKVSGVPQTVTYDPILQAYTATVPLQASDVYNVEVDADDYGGNTTTVITFVSIAQGELVKVQVNDPHGNPVPGVTVTGFYRNPTGGTNHGRADLQTTAADGSAYLHLIAGNYNISISKAGFVTDVVNNIQVFFGINTFINTGGTVPESHVLLDNTGVVIASAHVKVTQNDLANTLALVAHQVTDVNGAWTIPLVTGKQYTFTLEKVGYDIEQVVVTGA